MPEDDEEFGQGGGQDNVNSEPVGDSQLAGDSEQGGEEDDEEPG